LKGEGLFFWSWRARSRIRSNADKACFGSARRVFGNEARARLPMTRDDDFLATLYPSSRIPEGFLALKAPTSFTL